MAHLARARWWVRMKNRDPIAMLTTNVHAVR
jgi:hypothetical protein